MYADNVDNNNCESAKVEVCSDININKSSPSVAINNHSQKTTDKYINKVERESFLQKLIPNQYKRDIVRHELMLVKEEFDYRRKVLSMTKEAQIQTLREKYNQYLIGGKTEIRGQITHFLMSKLQELEEKIDGLDDKFNEMIEAKTLKIQEIKNPKLKQAREKDLAKAIDRFLELKEESLKSFQAIISEGLKQ